MKHIKLYEDFSINEGRYDKITNVISSSIFKHWKNDFLLGEFESTFEETFENKDLYIDILATILFSNDYKEGLTIDGGADESTNYIEVRFEVNPDLLPNFWEEISMNLKDVIRHEIEHLTHGEGENLNINKKMDDDRFTRLLINTKILPKSMYFKLEKEIDANLQGMYFRAKKERKPFSEIINAYLDSQDISFDDKADILDLWRKRADMLNLPKF
jgi:hypothetical protein